MNDTLIIQTEGAFRIEVELTKAQSDYVSGKIVEHEKNTSGVKYFPMRVWIKDENTVEDLVPETKANPAAEVFMTEPENSTNADVEVREGDLIPETKADPSAEVYMDGKTGEDKVPETKANPVAEVTMKSPSKTKHAPVKAVKAEHKSTTKSKK